MKGRRKQFSSTYRFETDGSRNVAVLTIRSEETGEFYTSTWQTSRHCEDRLSQRGISYKHMLMAIEFGEVFFKQGLVYYTVIAKSLPNNLCQNEAKKINNIVVVVSSDGEIITCYRSKNAIKHIKRKRSDFVNN